MFHHRHTILITVFLFFISLIFCLDQFLHLGEAATFDSPIHITNMAMYHQALKAGDFPVTWADKFANYGLPIPIVSQQLTSYLGAALIFITASPVMAYKFILLLAVLVGIGATYLFLRLYTSSSSAIAGSILFTFSAYRILNTYIRGALPELFAASLIPVVLIGLHAIFHQKRFGLPLTILGLTLLIAAHPFVFLISLFIIIPYILYLMIDSRPKNSIKPVTQILIAFLISFGLNAWYLLPLVLEMKYFVISKNITQFVSGQFLNWSSYFTTVWPYFYKTDVFVRGNVIQFGTLETIILLGGLITLFIIYRHSKKYLNLLFFITITSLILIFLTLSPSLPLYLNIPFMDGIQFPWRMLLALGFMPVLVLALLLDKLPKKKAFAFLFITLVLILRLPQTYGKNFTLYPLDHYTRTIKNLHFDSLNTIWIGNTTNDLVAPPIEENTSPNRLDLSYTTDCAGVLTVTLTHKNNGQGISGEEVKFDYLDNIQSVVTDDNGQAIARYQYQTIDDMEVFVNKKALTIQVHKPTTECLKYPVKEFHGEIIEGTGQITWRNESNSYREYQIEATTPIRLVDYTFYFPGWKVLVDNQAVPIEFQDINYRGVITYQVPAGNHQVKVVFTNTKVRFVGRMITVITLVCLLSYLIMKKMRQKKKVAKP